MRILTHTAQSLPEDPSVRHIYTLFSVALAVFTAVGPAEAPRQEVVNTSTDGGAIVVPPAFAGSTSIYSSGTVDPFAMRFPAGVWTPTVGSLCCSADPNSMTAIASGPPMSILSLEDDGYTGAYALVTGAGGAIPSLEGLPLPWGNAATAVHGPWPTGGLSALSIPTALTSAGTGPGTLNLGPPPSSESVPEPSAFLLLVSGVVGLGLWRRTLLKRRS